MKYLVNNILPPKQKAQLRWKIIHYNTKVEQRNYFEKINPKFKQELTNFFLEDIEDLEDLIGKDLTDWKN